MISVIIPLYNKEKQIVSTLQTVLKQTYQDFEIIIVNDGSTDRSVLEVEKLKDKRIHLIHQSNAGVSAARNKGINEAVGEYVAFLDADDEWKKDYLYTQFCLTQKYSNCNVFVTNYELRDMGGNVTPTVIRKLKFTNDDGVLNNYFEVASCSHPPLWTSAVMVRKSAMDKIGGFPLGIKSGEDLLTWARLATEFKIAYSKKSMAVFNVEGYNFQEKPKRVPADEDIVGTELVRLMEKTRQSEMCQYISMWHKMRSSCYMRLNMRRKSIKEALIGLKYDFFNYKLYIYILLNLLPLHSRIYKK